MSPVWHARKILAPVTCPSCNIACPRKKKMKVVVYIKYYRDWYRSCCLYAVYIVPKIAKIEVGREERCEVTC